MGVAYEQGIKPEQTGSALQSPLQNLTVYTRMGSKTWSTLFPKNRPGSWA